jgi:hypothetical protein
MKTETQTGQILPFAPGPPSPREGRKVPADGAKVTIRDGHLAASVRVLDAAVADAYGGHRKKVLAFLSATPSSRTCTYLARSTKRPSRVSTRIRSPASM